MLKKNFNVLIFWASWFLWKKVYNYLSEKHKIIWTKFSSTNKKDNFIYCDISKVDSIKKLIKKHNPNIVINAVWLADPLKCDEFKKEASNSNYKFVKDLVPICKKFNIKLVHYSTDYVFGGNLESLIDEKTKVNPINYYWKLKVKAEKRVKKYKNSIIIRIPILFGIDKGDKLTFVTSVLNSLKFWKKIYLDNTQVRYPVLTDEIAITTEKLLKNNFEWLINISSKKGITKYYWAKIIAKTFWFDQSLVIEKNMSEKELKEKPINNKFSLIKQDKLNIKISSINKSTNILYKQLHCGLNLVYKSNPKDSFLWINVANYRISCGKALKNTILTKWRDNIILPIPESWIFSAVWLSKYSKIPYIPAIVKNHYYGRLFNINDTKKRECLTNYKLILIPELIYNKNIYLVDEAIFTWTTLKVMINKIKEYNPKSIHVRIPSPIVNKKCRYYMQPIRRLLWESLSRESMKKYFWVDSIEFINVKDFLEITNNKDVCFDCFKLCK